MEKQGTCLRMSEHVCAKWKDSRFDCIKNWMDSTLKRGTSQLAPREALKISPDCILHAQGLTLFRQRNVHQLFAIANFLPVRLPARRAFIDLNKIEMLPLLDHIKPRSFDCPVNQSVSRSPFSDRSFQQSYVIIYFCSRAAWSNKIKSKSRRHYIETIFTSAEPKKKNLETYTKII